MKLLLIYPSEKQLIDSELPKILEAGVGSSPPLGLLYVAASVKKHTQWQVELLDCLAENLTYSQISNRIAEFKPDIVGITVMTHQLLDCLAIAKLAKEASEDIKVVMGGPHAHIYPRETVSFNCVDYVITGEAELAMVAFLNALAAPDKLKAVPGIFFKTSKGVFSGPPAQLIENIDSLSHPRRQISKYKLYASPLASEGIVSSMITSRGCPFQCLFCDRPHLSKKFRARSPSDVVREMQECRELGIKHIKIYDDTFTVDRPRVLDICQEIKKCKLGISWDIRAHINTIDCVMLKALSESGCKLISYGVESGNNEVLKTLRKGITVEKALEVFKLTRAAGIKTLAYFMLGAPGETEGQMIETIQFAKKLKPDYCHFTILVPFPATPVYVQGLEKGILGADYWLEFARQPSANFKPQVWVEHVSRLRMCELLAKAYKEFYLRPSYLARRIIEIRSFADLKRKVRSGLCLLSN